MTRTIRNLLQALNRLALTILATSAFGCGQALAEAELNWTFDVPGSEALQQPRITTQFSRPDFVPGVLGRAWRSDGFSSWVSGPVSLSPNKGFTVQGWVALESYPSGYEKPVEEQIPASLFQQATKDLGFDLSIDPYGRWGVRVSTTAGTVRVAAKDVFPVDKWVHVASTFDPEKGDTRLYLDGVLVGEQVGKRGMLNPAPVDFQVGHSWRAAPLGVFNINGIDGAFDEVSVTNRALSSAEIAASAKSATPPDARASLIVPASRFAGDLQRPAFHALPPSNWTNEPHGLIRRGGTWHMFYQRTPNGPYKTLMTWGHLKSEDLIHWTDLPIALRPELQTADFGFDMKGIWSGDVVTGPGGFAFAFYTSVNHSAHFYNPGISLAISDDPGLLHWQKAGPLIDRTGVDDFRDPYVWFEGGEARMIVGAALGSSGGLAYYRCTNLASRSCWKKQLHFAPFGQMDIGSAIWEMPVFTRLAGDKYILEANPIGGKVSKYGAPSTRSVYWIGKWDGTTFTPDNARAKMLDLLPGHLSPTVDRTAGGDIVGIGIVDERRTPEAQLKAGWAHSFSLPRVWRLMPDGETLGQSPLPALNQLRQRNSKIDVGASGAGDRVAGDLGRAVEIEARFATPPSHGTYGLTLATSPDGRETTRIFYDADTHEFVIDKQHSTLSAEGEGPQLLRGGYDDKAFGMPHDFHVYVDHSVVDVFINNAAAFSFRIYPTQLGSTRFGLMSSTLVSAQVQAWRMNPAPNN